jgi:hypothetical protein
MFVIVDDGEVGVTETPLSVQADDLKLISSTCPASLIMSNNPPPKGYEFLGPPGAFFITLAVPLVTYSLYFSCSERSGGCPPYLPFETLKHNTLRALTSRIWWENLWDSQAALLYLAWYTFCVISWPFYRVIGWKVSLCVPVNARSTRSTVIFFPFTVSCPYLH